MNRSARRLIIFNLIALNDIVLLGQLWPEWAPPFVLVVNIVLLLGSLAYFVNEVWRWKEQGR